MAESDHEKSEQPTHRKKTKARSKGDVVKSTELKSAIIILSSALIMKSAGPWMKVQFMEQVTLAFANSTTLPVTEDTVPGIAAEWVLWAGHLLGPLFLAFAAVAIVTTAALQGGFVFTTQKLAVNIGRLNPISGAKQLFSSRMIFNLLRDLVKVILLAMVSYSIVRSAVDLFLNIPDNDLGRTLTNVGGLVTDLLWRTGLVLLVIGMADYAFQRRKHNKDLMMSKREVKDEMKESDGDPLVKGRIRAAQKELARKRMMLAVPDADVVLTNPTEYAVALKYDPAEMSAPTVVAKGRRLIAQKIKEIAIEAGVPIVENKALARSLWKLVPVDGIVPGELYRAVAEVLSFVYKQKNRVKDFTQPIGRDS